MAPQGQDLGTVISRSLEPVAAAILALVRESNPAPMPGSPAVVEADTFKALHNLPADWEYRNPIELVALLLHSRLFLIADYLRGIAIIGEQGGSREQPVAYSAAALVRAALEALAFTYWLAEPEIGHEERVRRLVLDTLNDLQARHRIVTLARIDGVDIVLDTEGLATMCDAYHVAYRWGRRDSETGIQFPVVQGNKRPSAFEILKELLPSKEYTNLGAIVYHVMSDIAHASTQGVLGPASLSQGSAGGLEIGFSRTAVLKHVAPILWAVPGPLTAVVDYYGWDKAAFQEVVAPSLERLAEAVDLR